MKLRIEFSKSTSKSYGPACALLRKLGGSVDDDGAAHLEIAAQDLKANGALILKLYQMIYPWKSSEIYLDDKPIHKREAWVHLVRLNECIENWEGAVNQTNYCRGIPHWCRRDPLRSHTFGCRLLNDLAGHRYNEENWWDCGTLDANGRFHIDKKRLLEVLDIEARRKCLYACLSFDFEKVRETVRNEFPEAIDPKIERGWVYVTVNGRHVGIEPKPRQQANPMEIRFAKEDLRRALKDLDEEDDDDKKFTVS